MLRINNLIGFGSDLLDAGLRPSLIASDDGFYVPVLTGGVSYVTLDSGTAANVTLSGSDLVVTNTGSGLINMGARVADAFGKTSGKFCFETTLTTVATGGSIGLGIGTIASTFANINNDGTTGVTLFNSGQIWSVGSPIGNMGGALSAGNVIEHVVDLDNRKYWARVAPSGNWNNDVSADPATNTNGLTIPAGTMVPFISFRGVSMGPGNVVTANFGASAFTGTVPAGITSGWTN